MDFYHAKEKLVLFAKHHFTKDDKRKKWLEEQCEELLNDGVYEVIKSLKKTPVRNEKAKEYRKKAISYFEEHEDKMM